MGSKKKKNVTVSEMTNVNQNMITKNIFDVSNILDSDDESVYNPLKYPQDNKLQEFMKNFKPSTQDLVAAGPRGKDESNNATQNETNYCGTCSFKFNKKSYSVGCASCLKWYCSSCAKVSRKELPELKKLKEGWQCSNCTKSSNDHSYELGRNVKQLEEENKLFKQIILDMNEKINILSEKFELMNSNKFLSKIDNLEKKVDQLINLHNNSKSQDSPKKYYSEILANAPQRTPKQNLPVIIIKPKKNQTSQKTRQDLQKNVNPVTVNASVKSVREIKNGGIIIKSNSQEEINKLKILSEEKLNENYTVEVSRMKTPQIVIIGSKKNYENQELIAELLALNHIDREDKLSITGSRKSKFSNLFIIYVEVIGRTFRKSANKDFFLGWDKCKIREAFSVTFCFKCCEYGHKSNDCSNQLKCKFCSGGHLYRSCREQTPQCTNCLFSNSKYSTTYDCRHEALNESCPIHKLRTLKAKEKIDYSSKLIGNER